jgi:hypothetical protein
MVIREVVVIAESDGAYERAAVAAASALGSHAGRGSGQRSFPLTLLLSSCTRQAIHAWTLELFLRRNIYEVNDTKWGKVKKLG